MPNKFIAPAAITAVGVVAIALLVFAKPTPVAHPPSGEAALLSVAVISAEPQTTEIAVIAQGTVKPKQEIELIAQVSGQIVAVEPTFVEGGFFADQEVLLSIDERDYQTALLQAQARLAEAKQHLAQEQGLSRQAKREWRDLGNQAANDLFVRKPQLAAAEAQVAAARGVMQQAQLDLERTKIRVPFAGRVKNVLANLGQYVSVGTPLARVYSSETVEIPLALTEQQAALVDLPLKPDPERKPTPVKVRANVAGTPHEWAGVLARTQAFVDENSRMIYALVEVKQPFASEVPLLPGVFAEAHLKGKTLTQVYVLPRSALYKQNLVYTLNDTNQVTPRTVKVLQKTADQVWVQGDIPPGTIITLEKQTLMAEGKEVNPVPNNSIAEG